MGIAQKSPNMPRLRTVNPGLIMVNLWFMMVNNVFFLIQNPNSWTIGPPAYSKSSQFPTEMDGDEIIDIAQGTT